MPRFAPKMSIDDLKNRLIDLATAHDYIEQYGTIDDDTNFTFESIIGMLTEEELLNKVNSDWNKIDFDGENVHVEGFKMTPDGVPYVYIHRGGDWESPVACILYYDGKSFRGFVPKDGNCYNYKTKSAFGNADGDSDEKQSKIQFGTDNFYDLLPTDDKCIAEINSRIVARGEATYDSKPVKSAAKVKRERQAIAEQSIDLTGDITKDMVYAAISLAAGSSYIEFKLKVSGRLLTSLECGRLVGMPATFKKQVVSDHTLWYSPNNVYPLAAAKMLESAGFTLDPDTDLSCYANARTQVIFI